MTDYRRKREPSSKISGYFGLAIVVVLVFVALSGVFKSSQKDDRETVSWDGRSAFYAVLNSDPVSFFIYNPTVKKITLLKLDDNLYVPTGEDGNPIEKLSDITDESDGEGLTKTASGITRTAVLNYVMFDEPTTVDEKNLEKKFKQFASLTTPLKMIFGSGPVEDTNLALKDWYRLWWQVKSLSVNDISLVDASTNAEDIVLPKGDSVLGVDEVALHRLMGQYLEVHSVLEEGSQIEIVNSSGIYDWGQMAADFVGASGGRVSVINESDLVNERTTIQVHSENYTSSYLAKLFDCDITSVSSLEENQIRIVLGKDFGGLF